MTKDDDPPKRKADETKKKVDYQKKLKERLEKNSEDKAADQSDEEIARSRNRSSGAAWMALNQNFLFSEFNLDAQPKSAL